MIQAKRLAAFAALSLVQVQGLDLDVSNTGKS